MRTEQQIRSQIAEIERYMQPFKRQIRTLKRALRKAKGLPAKKSEPRTYVRGGHEYLAGYEAHALRRLEIYRNAGGDAHIFDLGDPHTAKLAEDLKTGMCQGCAETHPVGWYEGEWHHNVKTLGGKRCDCVACGLWVCADWHRRYHNRVVKSGKVDA